MSKPAWIRPPASTALAIMNNALRMLFAAMMRARCVGWARSWISAYIGTLYSPAHSDSRNRSAITRQCAGSARNPRSV